MTRTNERPGETFTSPPMKVCESFDESFGLSSEINGLGGHRSRFGPRNFQNFQPYIERGERKFAGAAW
jgi:hypothetical protein